MWKLYVNVFVSQYAILYRPLLQNDFNQSVNLFEAHGPGDGIITLP